LFVVSHSKVNNIKDLSKYQMLKKCCCYQRTINGQEVLYDDMGW